MGESRSVKSSQFLPKTLSCCMMGGLSRLLWLDSCFSIASDGEALNTHQRGTAMHLSNGFHEHRLIQLQHVTVSTFHWTLISRLQRWAWLSKTCFCYLFSWSKNRHKGDMWSTWMFASSNCCSPRTSWRWTHGLSDFFVGCQDWTSENHSGFVS